MCSTLNSTANIRATVGRIDTILKGTSNATETETKFFEKTKLSVKQAGPLPVLNLLRATPLVLHPKTKELEISTEKASPSEQDERTQNLKEPLEKTKKTIALLQDKQIGSREI